jgi:membrane protease subunit (stomatin/prohibitin family)
MMIAHSERRFMMAVIEVLKWDATPDVYAYKYPSEELGTWTQLIVSESQEAVLLKEGVLVGPFGPGRHTLSTKNFPVLIDLVKKVTGNRTPFTAEVWYVNRTIALDVKWGTADPIQVQDPKFHVMLPVRSFGQYGVQIDDSACFVKKLVGTMNGFNRDQLTAYFRGLMLTHVKDQIATAIVKRNISILEITANLSEISRDLQAAMKPLLAEYGLRLTNFYVNSINTPEDDPAVCRLKEALAKRAEMDIIGYDYTQERSFDTMQSAASNTGSAQSGLMGAGIGLGMGLGVGGGMGSVMKQMAGQLSTEGTIPCPKCGAAAPKSAKFCNGCGGAIDGAPTGAKAVVCIKCGKSSPSGSNFCAVCGDPFLICPACGANNGKHAKTCGECGKAMPVTCPKCESNVPGDGKFCPSCGATLVVLCSKCQATIKDNAKFCSECGTPTEDESDAV